MAYYSQIAKFMGPTWGPPGSCRPQMGPMLAPLTLLSGLLHLQAQQHTCQDTLDISRQPHWNSMGLPKIPRVTLTGMQQGPSLGPVHIQVGQALYPPLSNHTFRFNKVERGYTGFTLSVCPSVRLSICGQNRVHSVSSTILIGSISYLHILSSNFRRCVSCNVCFKIKKLWRFF